MARPPSSPGRRAAWAGADLALADVADRANEDLAAETRGRGRWAIALHVDVCSTQEVETVIQRTLAEFGRIEKFVNLAGVIHRIQSAEHPIDRWELQMDINLKGTWLTCQAAGVGPTLFLASEAARWTTRFTIRARGGLNAT
jgi:NAD(P)-dependent dehydrogenase (short-subunit alcohol dehydrogenase family)